MEIVVAAGLVIALIGTFINSMYLLKLEKQIGSVKTMSNLSEIKEELV